MLFSAVLDDGQTLDQETCEKLFSVQSIGKPARVGDNPPQLLLANDPDESVRARLIERDSHFMFTLHSRAQEILAQDVEQDIRESLATYPKLKPSAQLVLAKDDETVIDRDDINYSSSLPLAQGIKFDI